MLSRTDERIGPEQAEDNRFFGALQAGVWALPVWIVLSSVFSRCTEIEEMHAAPTVQDQQAVTQTFPQAPSRTFDNMVLPVQQLDR